MKNKIRDLRLKISAKIQILVCFLLLLLVVTNTIAVIWYNNDKLIEELKARGKIIARELSKSVETIMLEERYFKLKDVINEFLEHTDAQSVAIINTDNIIVGHDNEEMLNQLLDVDISIDIETGYDFEEHEDFLRFYYHIIEGAKGYVYVDVPTDVINTSRLEIILFTIVISSIVIILGLLISMFAMRLFTTPIKKMLNIVKKLGEGEGNLSFRIPQQTKDEIGDLSVSFNLFMSKLESIVRNVKKYSDSVFSNVQGESTIIDDNQQELKLLEEIVNQITQSSELQVDSVKNSKQHITNMFNHIDQMIETIQNQNELIKTSTSSMEQIHSSIKKMVDTSKHASQATSQLSNIANEGSLSIRSAIRGIKDIAGSTKQIQEWVVVITSISEQTNLLAMNAAIEAAHAGDYGRGFAVVADEIRKLAHSSSDSAKNISTSIKKILKMVSNTVKDGEKAQLGLDEILSEIEQSVKTTHEISSGFNEHLTTINTITSINSQLLHNTDKINSSVQEQKKYHSNIINLIDNLEQLATNIIDHTNNQQEKVDGLVSSLLQVFKLVTDSQKDIEKLHGHVNKFVISEELEQSETAIIERI